MKSWHETIPSLEDAIRECFPSASDNNVSVWAQKIYDNTSPAAAVEWIERSDTKPSADSKAIESAATHLRKAAKELAAVGWHGMGALTEIADQVYRTQHNYPGKLILTRRDATDVLARFFSGMADEIDVAAKDIDLSAPSVMSGFQPEGPQEPSKGRPRGRPLETAAYYAAKETYAAYASLSGTRPTVSTDAHAFGNPAYGPFLSFLDKVFACLEIRASAETWARKVCKEKNPKGL